MLPYIITLVIYLLSQEASYMLTGDRTISIAAKLVLTTASIIYFRKDFKFRPRFDALAIASGILIAVIWIAIDPFYPHIGSAVVDMVPFTAVELIIRLINSIILASIVEEFFTRFFLHRWVQTKNWKSVKLGVFSLNAFIITVLFFGFSHSRWLAGIISGMIFNLVFYKTKDMSGPILSHSTANAVIAIYVIYFQAWQFW